MITTLLIKRNVAVIRSSGCYTFTLGMILLCRHILVKEERMEKEQLADQGNAIKLCFGLMCFVTSQTC